MQLCEYGCGQEATHQFKNGKFCCGNNIGKCSAVNKKGITKKKFFKSIMISEDKNILCDYGCGQRAIYQFNNSKVCCSDNTNGCPSIKLKKIKEEKVIPLIYTGIGLCSYGCGKIAKYKFKNGKICCSSNSSKCPIIVNQRRIKNTGKKRTREFCENSRDINLNKMVSEETKKILKNLNKKSIDYWKENYPTFAKEEEMRYNPDKPIEEKEIQVHCKNSHCENSKENGGWFTPTYIQLYERIRQVEKANGTGGSYLYCSQHCKDTCPLYRSTGKDPYRDMIDNSLDSVEWNLIRQMRFKLDNNECQICGTKENLRCHHIQPVKTYSQLSLDIENCITLCNICHNKVHSGKDKDCSTGGLAKIVCKENKKSNTNEKLEQNINLKLMKWEK